MDAVQWRPKRYAFVADVASLAGAAGSLVHLITAFPELPVNALVPMQFGPGGGVNWSWQGRGAFLLFPGMCIGIPLLMHYGSLSFLPELLLLFFLY